MRACVCACWQKRTKPLMRLQEFREGAQETVALAMQLVVFGPLLGLHALNDDKWERTVHVLTASSVVSLAYASSTFAGDLQRLFRAMRKTARSVDMPYAEDVLRDAAKSVEKLMKESK